MFGRICDRAHPYHHAQINDEFRRKVGYSNCPYVGRMLVTAGIHVRGGVFASEVVSAVREDTNFTEDNDPNYYMGSEDPLDGEKTARVLTVMLPHEW